MTITKRKLGGRQVNPIGLGCMSLSFAYGYQPPDEVGEALLKKALDLGYDHLDTARIYGLGHSETLIGKTLKGMRDRVYLASKTGIFPKDGHRRAIDNSPESIRAGCEESLRCLQTDHIDLYYLHRLDNRTPLEESVGTLAELVKEGKIGGIGLSEVSADNLRRAAAVHPIAAVQTEYSLWTRNPEIAVLDTCRELGTTFVAFSPLGRGVLANGFRDPAAMAADDFRATIPRFLPENWPQNLALVDQFNAIAVAEGVTPAQLSLAWVLSRGDHVVAIPGTGNIDHMAENIARWQWQPSAAAMVQLEQLINQHTVVGDRYSPPMKVHVSTEDFG